MSIIRNIGSMLDRPVVGGFCFYLVLLWLLNIADTVQTILLSHGGNLRVEANLFMNYFLDENWKMFVLAKFLPLVLVTAMVIRGYFDKKGTTIAGHRYTPEEIRRAIVFLLAAGVIYYVIIVLIPFVIILLNLFFN